MYKNFDPGWITQCIASFKATEDEGCGHPARLYSDLVLPSSGSAHHVVSSLYVSKQKYNAWLRVFTWPLSLIFAAYYTDGSVSLIALAGASFHLIFGKFLWVQTDRVRCRFEKDAFEFYNLKDRGNGPQLEAKRNNYVADTKNRWKYDSIINYGFFPSELFPVICYFKETETPEWKWDRWVKQTDWYFFHPKSELTIPLPMMFSHFLLTLTWSFLELSLSILQHRWFAGFDSYGLGQPHFFPGICNAKKFKEEMELRGVKSKPIPTLNAPRKA